MRLPQGLAERIQALRDQIDRLLQERARADRELQVALVMLEHYMAVWEAEATSRLPRLARVGTEAARPPEQHEGPKLPAPKPAARSQASVYQLVLTTLERQRGALHGNEIAQLLRRDYPEAANRYADLSRQVGVALVRGVQRGALERTGPNTFRYRGKADPTEPTPP